LIYSALGSLSRVATSTNSFTLSYSEYKFKTRTNLLGTHIYSHHQYAANPFDMIYDHLNKHNIDLPSCSTLERLYSHITLMLNLAVFWRALGKALAARCIEELSAYAPYGI